MPILPQCALFVILQWWSAILQLVSAIWYERQLVRYRDHWLVQLHPLADFTPLEQACAGFHPDRGRGAPVIHPIPRLVRALLVKYLHNLSLRLTEELIDNHLLIKWFVGYGLFERPPDHSTLNRFELWVFQHQPRLFFDEVIRLIDRVCPEDRPRIQIVDTFGMEARAAKTYLIDLLRAMASPMLCWLAETDPDRHLALLARLDLLDLLGQPGEKITPALTGQERVQRLQQVGRQSLALYHHLSDSLDQAPHLGPDQQLPLRLLLASRSKIITAETTVTLSQPDQPQTASVVKRPHGDKGSYRMGSASDLTATYRKHDQEKEAILGYNPTVLTTSVFIRETQVDTAAQPDNVALPEVLQSQFDHHGFFPDHVAGDRIYGYGKTRAQVAEVTHGQTQLIAHLPDYDQRSPLFNPRHFILADDGLSLTCPNHQTTSQRYQTEGKGGFDFRFPARLCRICPLADQCRGPEAKKTAPRNVFISFYRDQVDPTLRFNQTETFKRGIKIRMHIERIIYCLTHIYGARTAQSYGQPRVDFQLKMQTTAFNLRQLVREVLKKPCLTQAGVCPEAA